MRGIGMKPGIAKTAENLEFGVIRRRTKDFFVRRT
jgi:hypothetical protein